MARYSNCNLKYISYSRMLLDRLRQTAPTKFQNLTDATHRVDQCNELINNENNNDKHKSLHWSWKSFCGSNNNVKNLKLLREKFRLYLAKRRLRWKQMWRLGIRENFVRKWWFSQKPTFENLKKMSYLLFHCFMVATYKVKPLFRPVIILCKEGSPAYI